VVLRRVRSVIRDLLLQVVLRKVKEADREEEDRVEIRWLPVERQPAETRQLLVERRAVVAHRLAEVINHPNS
jgi:hypothetical protein